MAQGRRHASGRVRGGGEADSTAPIATDRHAVAAKIAGFCRESSIVLPYPWNVAGTSLADNNAGRGDGCSGLHQGRVFWPELPARVGDYPN